MLIFSVWHGPVGAEQSEFGVSVGQGDSCEKASSCGVSVPVVGLGAPALADDDELSTNGGRVSGAGFGDGGLEDEGARGKQFADGGGDGLAFALGLARIL